ncbi:MAG: carbonic anhydrase [Acidobacteriota bacterium]|nr:carbonic anhydrase [Acidobacteriota bacterium]MDQ7088489.1 carbonic anhydrase [Acidobacteriota bacterium]
MDVARQALDRLRQGNRRFVGGLAARHGARDADRRRALVSGQKPVAVVVACADSRVPPEIVFDQGLGDLFVVRVAGNVIDPVVLGSVEFAVESLGTRLIVVLGHSRCGAVAATVDVVESGRDADSPHLRAIVERIRPAVDAARDVAGAVERAEWIRRAVRRNVQNSAGTLRDDSRVLARAAREDGLLIVAAHYSLDTGEVAFSGSDAAR